MYYLELDCLGKKPKGRIYDDHNKAVRKFRQYAKYKRTCKVRLYRFRWNRLEKITESRRQPFLRTK